MSRPRLADILRMIDPSYPATTTIIADVIAERIDADEFGNDDNYGIVAPPWRSFFVEARTVARGQIVDRGMLVQDMSHDERIMRKLHLSGYPLPEGTHWIVGLHGFLRVAASDLILFPGMAFLHLDEQGHRLEGNVKIVRYLHEQLLPDATYCPEEDLPSLAEFVPFTLRAIGALHQRAPVTHVQVTRAQRRQAERETGVPVNDHYVIGVPLQAPVRRAGAAPLPRGATAERREHQVRGHFRVYTPDKPLFGRISGLVWIPTHQRGGTGAGSVTKDYEIR